MTIRRSDAMPEKETSSTITGTRPATDETDSVGSVDDWADDSPRWFSNAPVRRDT